MRPAAALVKAGALGPQKRRLNVANSWVIIGEMRPVSAGFCCNNACGFCSQGALRAFRPRPSDAAVRCAVEAALREDRELAFVGGEPTLREELPAWIAHAKSLGASWILLQTNGRRLVYPGYCAALKAAGLDACEVALQGSTAAMHDYHTEAPGSFRQTAAGLRQARAAGLEVCAGAVVTRSNFRHLPELVRLAKSLGARALRLAAARPVGRAAAARDRLLPSPELVAPFLEAALTLARKLDFAAFAEDAAPRELRRFFAGLGECEPAAAPQAERRLELPASKPKPGAREVRAPRKRTGSELKAIFPGLFEDGAR